MNCKRKFCFDILDVNYLLVTNIVELMKKTRQAINILLCIIKSDWFKLSTLRVSYFQYFTIMHRVLRNVLLKKVVIMDVCTSGKNPGKSGKQLTSGERKVLQNVYSRLSGPPRIFLGWFLSLPVMCSGKNLHSLSYEWFTGINFVYCPFTLLCRIFFLRITRRTFISVKFFPIFQHYVVVLVIGNCEP